MYVLHNQQDSKFVHSDHLIQRPYSQTQCSRSMICDFRNDIFLSSGLNNHDEQICCHIGTVSTNSTNRMKQIFSKERKQEMAPR